MKLLKVGGVVRGPVPTLADKRCTPYCNATTHGIFHANARGLPMYLVDNCGLQAGALALDLAPHPH